MSPSQIPDPNSINGAAKPVLSLDIAIVGAGITGLITATALRRAGHKVTVYEQSSLSNEIGAAIHLAPNATRILAQMGFEPERAKCVENGVSTLMDGVTKEVKSYRTLDHMRPTYGYPWYLIHRVDLHNELKRLAFDKDGAGIPAVLKTGHCVISLDPEIPSLTSSNGTTIYPDLIIGADGVHSTVVKFITGKLSVAKPTGFSAYRFLVTAKSLLEDPQTQWLVKDQPVLMASFTSGEKRLAVYPCRNRELMNFVAIHPAKTAENEKEDWNVAGSLDGLLATYSHFHPDILALCKHAQDLQDLKLWPLLYRSPITTWAVGKAVIAGDAAHPMLPHQGQGGGMALEDGGCLGILLANITSKSEIPERLRLFQEIRFERASAVQILSNTGYDEVEKIKEEAKQYVKTLTLPRNQPEIHEFFFSYNVMEDARIKLQEMTNKKNMVGQEA